MNRFRVAVDIGGTFTDIVVLDAGGRLHVKKVSSAPARRDTPSSARLSAGARLWPSRVVGAALAALAIVAAGTPAATTAQAPARVPRVGFLIPTAFPLETEGPIEWLKQLGYLERRNIAFEYRIAAGRDDRLPELARELVRSRVDVIVTGGTPAIRAARAATRTIPIVMIAHGDPVLAGFIASLARPGGNVTGITVLTSEIAAKRLELLKEFVPRLSRVAVLWNPDDPDAAVERSETEAAARTLGLELVSSEARGPADLEPALATAARGRVGGLVVILDRLTMSNSKPIADLAAKHRLPAVYSRRQFIDRLGGAGLMSYGPSSLDIARRVAAYIDRILKGGSPASLPVEEPHEFELVLNVTTATALGLTIPESIRVRASVVVE